MSVEKNGEVSCLVNGANLATELGKSYHTIESWRLLKILIAVSKQYHGREHNLTQTLEGVLSIHFKTAYVVSL
jgi:hypothetical protein